ncbi:DNA ligase D, ligase domain (plasmid) [Rhizobium leguminosarum]|uniref:DNA ligase D, ligase domain n=1 Tax=Rhizobium leguminosarum TaxID=384 RepID=A0A2Z4YU64_RHILE|nr:DNA ligase D, ligase domain [Rhizobium leguminosarum]
MPDRVEPCLALLKAKPPKGDDWVYEIKWDGYRLAIHVEPRGIRILTRGGHDWTDRFPAIKQAAMWLPVGTAILDGEAVVLDEQGRSDFGLLQQSLGGRGGKKSSSDAIFMAFDLLYFDGHDLRNSELDMRRHLLEDLVPPEEQGDIRLSKEIEADGEALLRVACAHGLEGLIAKRRDAPYSSGRLGDWVKVKCVQSDGFLIVGYEKSTGGHRSAAARRAQRQPARLCRGSGNWLKRTFRRGSARADGQADHRQARGRYREEAECGLRPA